MKVLIHIQNYKKNDSFAPQDIKQFMKNKFNLSITKADQKDDWVYLELENQEGGD